MDVRNGVERTGSSKPARGYRGTRGAAEGTGGCRGTAEDPKGVTLRSESRSVNR